MSFALPALASGVFEELVKILVNASNDANSGSFYGISADEKDLIVKIAIALCEGQYNRDRGCLTLRRRIYIDTVNPYADERICRINRKREGR
ncbi:MAG: hypothetical protein ACE5HK_06540 [Candidatus Methylomirabilales bacterium]